MASDRFAASLERYRQGVWRDRILHDLILDDARTMAPPLTFLDIGCGQGFDTDAPLQRSLAHSAAKYIGIEPDTTIVPQDCFTELHRCLLERSAVSPGSVDIAFAIMVLEHLPDPQRFWDKLYDVLKPGGVFWGLTIDARHWFSIVSLWMDRLRVKNLYLRWLLGPSGNERYENYPLYYACNTPDQISRYTASFRTRDFLSLSREGQLCGYLPRVAHGLSRWVDRRARHGIKPGTLLAVRVQK